MFDPQTCRGPGTTKPELSCGLALNPVLDLRLALPMHLGLVLHDALRIMLRDLSCALQRFHLGRLDPAELEQCSSMLRSQLIERHLELAILALRRLKLLLEDFALTV